MSDDEQVERRPLEVEQQNDTNGKFFVYKNETIDNKWIMFHWLLLFLSTILFIICLVIPITGSFALFIVILLGISMDCIITISVCTNGICCKSKIKKMNQIDDLCSLITTFLWILSLFIAMICGISDTASKYTSYNRWEEFIPILIVLLIEMLLCQKLLIRYSSYSLPLIHNTNYNSYHEDILSNSASYIHFCIPCKWLFLLCFIFFAFTLFIHSIQKSLFINSFNLRNTNILTTENFGTFEFECIGTTHSQNADIRILTVTGMGMNQMSFHWYNNLIYKEYGIKQNKNISICGYNRGGFGFTETKKYRDKLIKTDVEHLIQIADVLFGKNKSFHLIGHSRGGVMLIQTKILYNNRIESMVFVDGTTNTNKIKYNPSKEFDWERGAIQSYTVAGIISPMFTFDMLMNFIGNINQYYEPELLAKYYGFRNYYLQSAVWELADFQMGYDNTIKLYIEKNSNFDAENAFNIECVEYSQAIQYSEINNTLYVEAGHMPCAVDKDIVNMIFYYNNTGLKNFYDSLFD